MISFIVPAHNEARLIGQNSQAIQESAHQLAKPFEVKVVKWANESGLFRRLRFTSPSCGISLSMSTRGRKTIFGQGVASACVSGFACH
jgi:hypothetical protein